MLIAASKLLGEESDQTLTDAYEDEEPQLFLSKQLNGLAVVKTFLSDFQRRIRLFWSFM